VSTQAALASQELVRLARVLEERAGISAPTSWLIECAGLLPTSPVAGATAGTARPRALDVACGSGRHALLLAAAGLDVLAIDRDAAAVEGLRATAGALGLGVRAEICDLESGDVATGDLGRGSLAGARGALAPSTYDLIVVVHYLHRPLLPALVRALAPGGLLLYETFTVDQAAFGHPKNPAFLLQHGELPRLVAPLEVVRRREGEFDGRRVASVAARAPIGTPS
jgi:SAM-dependent methyltransferase